MLDEEHLGGTTSLPSLAPACTAAMLKTGVRAAAADQVSPTFYSSTT